ncbi:MAG: hypothetical protein JO257_24090 [Deltaproteobacteria bacterium]|nr:hypothetical protein [Deltaproteobacteria bacterium]
MKKQDKPDTQQKPSKMSKLTSLVYSSAGIGLLTAAVVLIADGPKTPRWAGE